MDETELTSEQLLVMWETGVPVELMPTILALLRSIDASLKVLTEQTRPSSIVITTPQNPGTTWPWANTSISEMRTG